MLLFKKCVELKAAGFYQSYQSGGYYYLTPDILVPIEEAENMKSPAWNEEAKDEEIASRHHKQLTTISYSKNLVFCPDISELMLQCSDIFYAMKKTHHGFECLSIFTDLSKPGEDGGRARGEGSTAEEALANLFINYHSLQ